ncbi:MAG: L-threonylcarbamoyladenylate synthase [Chloroflexota bacterium]|nr:threonylcarbamoyl-AMP synthase [Anaerolineae bacterium]
MLLRVNPVQPEEDVIRQAAEVIRQGGLVAFPTETVYGLGADALNEAAVARIFAAKERPAEDPLIVHIANIEDLRRVARDLPPQVHALSQVFWPGPLSLILPRAAAIPASVTAGLDTVAVRMPGHPVALALIHAAGTPIAAPSANLFSRPSSTTAQHVLEDLGERVDLILDGGPTLIGLESTVLDLSGEKPTILRPGGISREALGLVLEGIAVDTSTPSRREREEGGLPSPGLMGKHYSPRAELILFRGAEQEMLAAMKERLDELLAAGKRVGLLVAYEDRDSFAGYPVIIEYLGPQDNLSHVAARLFAAIRALDGQGVDVILARGFGTIGLGLAIEDRLAKAAGGRVVEIH